MTTITLAKNVPLPAITVTTLKTAYGAVDFLPALTLFLKKNLRSLSIMPSDVDLFDIYKRFKLSYRSLQGFGQPNEIDTVRAIPSQLPSQSGGSRTSAIFDTALVDCQGDGEIMGMEG